MTAQGKTTISSFRLGETRILVTDDRHGGIASDQALAGILPAGTALYPATRKTRVVAATVTGADTCGGSRRKRWYITTDRGPLGGSYPTHQTFWLAPDGVPAAKKVGDMTPAERAAAVKVAAATLNAELNHPAMRVALAEGLDPAPGADPLVAGMPRWARAAEALVGTTPPTTVTYAYQVSDNAARTWRTVGVGFSAVDVQAVRDRDPAGENTTWRAVAELSNPTTTAADPWADIS